MNMSFARLLFPVAFSLFLLGCAQLTSPSYSVTESQLNRYLTHTLNKPIEVKAPYLAKAKLAFNQLNADIGRSQKENIRLTGRSELSIATLLFSEAVGVNFAIDARPYYNAKTGEVFLKSVQIHDYKLTSSLGELSESAILPMLNQALTFYFDEQPIYRLDSKNSLLEAAVLKTDAQLEINEGKLTFRTNDKP